MSPSQLPLNDIVEAPAVGWWPLAWGWWGLLIAGVVMLAAVVVIWHRRQRRWRAQRAAKILLTGDYNSLSEINLVTKQAALAYFDRERVASLHGEAWFDFLQASIPPPHRAHFVNEMKPWLALLYAPQSDLNVEAYQQLMHFWVEKALPPATRGSEHV